MLGRGLRSGAFVALFAAYASIVIGAGQRLLVWPAILLLPRRRTALVRGWLRAHARATLGMAKAVAGMRFSVRGAIASESCVVIMNHQSVLDIPLGLSLIPGPQTVIPTRDRYRRGIPAISPLARLAGFPFVSQGRGLTRDEWRSLTEASDQVARGERCLLIFPEGHRTRNGRVGRFMRGGLRIVLPRAARPVYCIVADGMTTARTTSEAITGVAGSNVTVTILGPFEPPTDESVDAFIETMHQRMSEALAAMRAESNATADDATALAAG
jgi:1-acyl-sn-glycerol-3-phosphate acyltransferase